MLIISRDNNEVLESVRYLFDQEKIEYKYSNEYTGQKDNKIIFITDNSENVPDNVAGDLLIITNKRVNLKKYSNLSNAIITKLVSDNKKYTMAQSEYLFRYGIYSIVNQLVLDFINDKTIDKMIYDTSSCQLEPTDWVFNFDSIAESYAWLSRRNRNLEKERKVIEISSPNTYNDSDKEINYLSEYKKKKKKGMKISTIYIGTKEDIEKKKQNRYFNILTRKTGDNVKTYFCDINNLKEREPELFNKIKDGIAIYEDCVYKDTFDSEFSLGIVDCKLESVKEYSDIFDYILSNYCVLLVEGGNYVGI